MKQFIFHPLWPYILLSLFSPLLASCHQFYTTLTDSAALSLSDTSISFNHLTVILFVSSIWNHSNTQGWTPKKGEAVLSSGTSGRLPSADGQRHPLRKQHLSGRVRGTLWGESASETACGETSGIFLPSSDFTELTLGLIIVSHKAVKQLNLNIKWGT